jgi:hypothetical protein
MAGTRPAMTVKQARGSQVVTYDQFWQRYIRAHAQRHTRALHYTGSLLALTFRLPPHLHRAGLR